MTEFFERIPAEGTKMITVVEADKQHYRRLLSEAEQRIAELPASDHRTKMKDLLTHVKGEVVKIEGQNVVARQVLVALENDFSRLLEVTTEVRTGVARMTSAAVEGSLIEPTSASPEGTQDSVENETTLALLHTQWFDSFNKLRGDKTLPDMIHGMDKKTIFNDIQDILMRIDGKARIPQRYWPKLKNLFGFLGVDIQIPENLVEPEASSPFKLGFRPPTTPSL